MRICATGDSTVTSFVRCLALLTVLANLCAASALAGDATPIASVKNMDTDAHIDILSLKRSEGNTVTLQFVLVNDGPGDLSLVASNTRLVDLVGRRRYSVGLEMGTNCTAASGGRKSCWVMFAAPPAATKFVQVQFYGPWPLVSSPISE
jgi:hypothetical protein